jgi:hypothetical protein
VGKTVCKQLGHSERKGALNSKKTFCCYRLDTAYRKTEEVGVAIMLQAYVQEFCTFNLGLYSS